MEIDFSLLDRLIKDNLTFAMYRLPGSEDVNLILQNNNQVYKTDRFTDLTDKSGFVIAPFAVTEQYPIVLVRPDIHLKGIREINSYAQSYISQTFEGNRVITEEGSTSREDYEEMFRVFQHELRAENFQKLVLSRKQTHRLSQDFSFGKVFKKALSTYSNTFVYIANTPFSGVWIGSTPELFLSEQDGVFHTVALAGTQTLKEDTDMPIWSQKNIEEQQLVADYMRHQLSDNGLPYTNSETYTLRLENLAHLKTDFYFEKNEQLSIGEILRIIHPSPAVCGLPKEKAFNFINQVERHSRSYYSGFVGNLLMNREIDLYVNLRCMQIVGKTISLYAGGGILISSEKEEEWKETEDKMQTMCNILSE